MPEQEISPAVAVGEVSKKLLRILAIEKSGFVDDYLNVNVMGGIVQIKRGLVPADALKNMDNWQLEETLSGNGPIKDPQYRFVRKN